MTLLYSLLLWMAPFYGGGGVIGISFITQTAVCGGYNGKITVIASNGQPPYQYKLDYGSFQNSNVFTGVGGGTHQVTVTDGAGGSNTATVDLGDIPGPSLSASTTPATCLNNDGTITFSSSTGTPPFIFSFTNVTIAANGTYNNGVWTFPGLPSGFYQVLVVDQNGCTDNTSVTIQLNNDLTFSATSTENVCRGSGVVLTASSNGTSFSWSPTTGLSDPTILEPIASPTVTTTYLLTAIRGVCQTPLPVPVIVTVNPLPVADAGTVAPICYGKSTQLQGAGLSLAGGNLTYQWAPTDYLSDPTIANPTVIKPQQTVDYGLEVKDVNGCVSPVSHVTLTVGAPTRVFAGNDTAVLADQPVPLDAIDVNNSGFTQYQWSPAIGLSNAYIADPIATVTASTTYVVTATNAAGCEGVDSIRIAIASYADLFVPNAFSPNGDGHNDVLRVLPRGVKHLAYFQVYDRWGVQVFSTTNAAVGWDGSFQGRLLGAGTYIWMAGGTDVNGKTIQRKGVVVMVR